jgi:hypothetical protein
VSQAFGKTRDYFCFAKKKITNFCKKKRTNCPPANVQKHTFGGINRPKTAMFLHIISFDIPVPANYGGVIVIFNQIRALHEAGVKVILHCFQYGDRQPSEELEKYCHEVNYYPRSRSVWHQLSLRPFIMQSRRPSKLLKRLRKDNFPILFEGMHTCGFIDHKSLARRQKIVRMHNIEWQYYANLSELEDDVLQKAYFFIESIKLQRAEPTVVLHADQIITISTDDEAYFREMKPSTYYVPVFHPNKSVESALGRGEYVLFHGKLSVADNERAALWLMEEIFAETDIPLIVAGLEPSDRLKMLAEKYDNVSIVENPDDRTMIRLIREAHINLLVSFQRAGMKLKLVNSLFRGRFCIVNDKMVSGTGLAGLCYVRNSAAQIRQTIEAILTAPFEQGKINERRTILEKEYSNSENAAKLIEIIQKLGNGNA